MISRRDMIFRAGKGFSGIALASMLQDSLAAAQPMTTR